MLRQEVDELREQLAGTRQLLEREKVEKNKVRKKKL